ncbi:Neutral/alkaline nonlysosomal ceramidase [Hortaea werneckii]|nr:Neutral/alkaline nonlysosomal ceramidase [Hortaea werneckii]KAI6997873.1 Neutral/alkaline nonlysosomal ceramidase [Hortaea werneckii]KAI7148841.1 Neutral/alkaline nonlysosomal ceramidase [Hortaea werneckii]KAI7176115.1 Neutral/alkaline nonlysosomal ceramidase [Hortaea werneckii]
MAHSSLFLALAASLLLVVSTINILHRFYPSTLSLPWDIERPFGGFNADDAVENTDDGTPYLLGVGKADITGPVVEINFMGYADPAQTGSGLRQRLYSRAFIIGSVDKPDDRFVYLVLDTQSGDTAIRSGILQGLAELGGEYTVYGNQNVAVTGTHSHSGPGAWLNYLLPQITSKGFHKPSYHAIVDGAIASIVRAHDSLAPGRLSIGEADVNDGNINRSPYAYLANPADERAKYAHDIDKTMTVLRFRHTSNSSSATSEAKDVGILTWFPVHGTSMHGNNTLVTGDNKGVAAWMFESSIDDPNFVAGFSQANVGDTSPNVLGAYCEFGDHVGEQCDFKTSLCGNKTQPCHGRGPYWGRHDSGAASTYEIGRRQFEAAYKAWNGPSSSAAWKPVQGNVVRGVHHFVDLSNYNFTLPNGTEVSTCPAALGYSFAAGTTDGPGAFDFKQAQPDDPNASPLWKVVGNRIATPNDTQKACHAEKVILLDVGESDTPYVWSPNIVDMQLLRVGDLYMIVSPGEATTTAGRRWREAVQESALAALSSLPEDEETSEPKGTKPTVVLGGPANTYAHYIATREEYSIQRYEGASTLYGPHTLDAYINYTLTHLIPSLTEHEKESNKTRHSSSSSSISPPNTAILGPQPPIQVNNSWSFIAPVIVDRAPLFKSFGAVKKDVAARYNPGDTISATFVGANPRNNLRLDETFAAVEKFDYERTLAWHEVRRDVDWSLVFEWRRTSEVVGTSEVQIKWETGWEMGDWRFGAGQEEEGLADIGDEGENVHGDLLLTRRRQQQRRQRQRKDEDDLKGLYRLRYYGDAKAFSGKVTSFEGVSGEFRIE